MAQKLEQFENRLKKVEVGIHLGGSGSYIRDKSQFQVGTGAVNANDCSLAASTVVSRNIP
jgi:hypothetical protein